MNPQVLQFLGKLCGAPAVPAGPLAGVRLALRHGSALGWVIVLAGALGALVWWSYRRDTQVEPARRRKLIALRVLLIALLLLLFVQPVLTLTLGTSTRTTLEAELWSSPLYFLLVVIVASTEFTLRQRWDLK
jgi:hypothetical protein